MFKMVHSVNNSIYYCLLLCTPVYFYFVMLFFFPLIIGTSCEDSRERVSRERVPVSKNNEDKRIGD